MQPVFRGSYCQFGTGGLERDVEDLSELLTHLAEQRGAHTFALLGHSTGCQIIVQFLRSAASAPLRARVRVAVLQAPVSDREAAPASGVALEELLPRARASVGRGEPGAIVHVLYGIAPLSAQRTLDLFERGGNHFRRRALSSVSQAWLSSSSVYVFWGPGG